MVEVSDGGWKRLMDALAETSIVTYAASSMAALLVVLYVRHRRFLHWAVKRTVFLSVVTFLAFLGTLAAPFCNREQLEVNMVVMRMLTWVARHLYGLTTNVKGRAHLSAHRPTVFVCNHISSLDLVTMAAVWQRGTAAVGKRELIYVPFFGLAFWIAGNVLIDRRQSNKAIEAMHRTAENIRERHINTFLFPEGTRNREGDLLPFKKGAFHLAVQCQAHIVPICVHNYDHIYSSHNTTFTSGEVTVLPPVSTAGLTTDDVPALLERVRNDMVKELKS